MDIVLQQRFVNGEVGDRLNGLSNTEAYSMGVRSAYNLVITSIGSLRVANAYTPVTLSGLTEDVLFCEETKYNYMFLIGPTKVFTLNKLTNTIVDSVAHGVSGPNVINSFEDIMTVSNGSVIKFFVLNKTSGQIGTTNFLSQIKRPVRNRTPLEIGVYRWISVQEYDFQTQTYKAVKKLLKIASYKDLENCGTNASGNLLVKGISNVKRLYFIASNSLTEAVFADSEWNAGETFLNFEQGLIDDLYINGADADFASTSTDGAGNVYATAVTTPNVTYGKATRGTPIELSETTVKDACVFQNRLALITSTEIFFSAKFDYLDFLNSAEESSAFYVKPSPIRNTQPNLRKLIASRGLWINTDRGYYSMAYDAGFSAIDNYIHIVSDRKPSLEHAMIDDILYFIDNRGVLFSLHNMGEQSVNFKSIEVDKFDVNRKFLYLSSIIIDGVDYVAVQDQNKPTKVYLYRQTQDKMYSRVTLDFTENQGKRLCGWYSNYFAGRTLYNISNNFTTSAYIDVLPPNLQTKEKGLYLNNTIRYIKGVTVKLLNEDNVALTQLKINGIVLNKVDVDKYSVYTCITSFQINQGFRIEITHAGTSKILEVLGIEMMIQ